MAKEDEREGTTKTLAEQKLAAEIEKLQGETAKLALDAQSARDEARFPWLKVLLTALLTSLGAGLGGYFFGDSLQERSRVDTRKEVLKIYFGTDNNIPGKRKQILTFLDQTLAKDDPLLKKWLDGETGRVDADLSAINARTKELEQELEALKDERSEAAPVASAAPGVSAAAPSPATPHKKVAAAEPEPQRAAADPAPAPGTAGFTIASKSDTATAPLTELELASMIATLKGNTHQHPASPESLYDPKLDWSSPKGQTLLKAFKRLDLQNQIDTNKALALPPAALPPP